MLKWIRISTVPGVACSIIARVSVCFFLVNIFGTKVWLKWWLIGNTILVAILGIVSLALAWCQSDPVEGLWNTLLPAKRMDPNILLVFTYVSGGTKNVSYISFLVIICRDYVCLLTLKNRHFRSNGFNLCAIPHHNYLETQYGPKTQNRSLFSHGRLALWHGQLYYADPHIPHSNLLPVGRGGALEQYRTVLGRYFGVYAITSCDTKTTDRLSI